MQGGRNGDEPFIPGRRPDGHVQLKGPDVPASPAVSPADDWRQGIRLGLRLTTAHHPLCGWFQSDRYHVGKIQLCRGCVAAAPAFLLGFAIALFVFHHGLVYAFHVGLIGLLLGVPHGTTYLHRFPSAYRLFAKFAGGTGLGLLLAAVLVLPVPFWSRIVMLAGLAAAFLLLQGLRMRRILATCDACPWRRDWVNCPGFLGHDRHERHEDPFLC